MLTPDEEKFIVYWAANRKREKTFKSQLSLGLPIGLIIGLAVLANFMTGWYTRATMVANSQSTPIVLVIAIISIALFCSVFYKRHRWEMNEQTFMELNHKKNLSETEQQHGDQSSQEDVIIKQTTE
ncbi:MAG: hypothetical protein JWQ96_300 [Segetibacter sp.]|nr:hypothetical protein [Segetibacter sp.]